MVTEKRPEFEDELDMDFGDEAEIESGPSAVARGTRKNFLLLGLIIIFSVLAFYYIFFGSSKKEIVVLPEVSNKIAIIKPANSDHDLATIPTLPPPPPLEVPKPPEPVIIAPQPPVQKIPEMVPMPLTAPGTSPNKVDNFKATMEARKKSQIMLVGGSGGGATVTSDNSKTSQDKNGKDGAKTYIESDAYFTPEKTSASQQKVTRIGEMHAVIAQGKIIDAVVETAINTDFAGTVRAMVTRDVYAEAGKNILIPKGSRLIGTYPSAVTPGQNRVAIMWNRLIRPDGIDLMIDSDAVDKLGRAGIEGKLDNKYMEIFSNAILISALNIGFAVGADKLTNAQNQPSSTTTTTNATLGTSTSTSTNNTATNSATTGAVTDLGNVGKQITQNSLKNNPTITINQGTLVKVFVKKDLIFPAHMVMGGAKIVQ